MEVERVSLADALESLLERRSLIHCHAVTA
jgi:hypothetical protein